MLFSRVQSIFLRYIRNLFIFIESPRDCEIEQAIFHQNCVHPIVFYHFVFFVQTLKLESCSSTSSLCSL